MKLEVAVSMGVMLVGILIGVVLLFYAAMGGGGDESEAPAEARLESPYSFHQSA